MKRNTNPSPKVVETVLDRDRRCCRRCGTQIHGDRGMDWVLHHRRPRGMGSTRRPESNQPQNLVTLCAHDHDHVEKHREESRLDGFLVAQVDDPERVPLRVRTRSDLYPADRWVFLRADGSESDTHPDDEISVVSLPPFEQISPVQIEGIRDRYARVLVEAAESADEDMAVLAVETMGEAA